MRKSFTKFIAFVLLLVFFQKSCAVLWLHDWLHTNNKVAYTESRDGSYYVGQAKCTCLDDFFLPFTQPPEQYSASSLPVYTGYIVTTSVYFVSPHPLFYCLRAPPAA